MVVDNCEEDKEEGNRKAVLESIVTVITEDEVDKYHISDVLLPLPGHSVVFPDNESEKPFHFALETVYVCHAYVY